MPWCVLASELLLCMLLGFKVFVALKQSPGFLYPDRSTCAALEAGFPPILHFQISHASHHFHLFLPCLAELLSLTSFLALSPHVIYRQHFCFLRQLRLCHLPWIWSHDCTAGTSGTQLWGRVHLAEPFLGAPQLPSSSSLSLSGFCVTAA